MLRVLVFNICLAGCGRIGFDATDAQPPKDARVSDARVADANLGLPSFARLCDFGSHVIIENGIEEDDTVGRALAETIKAKCGPATTIRTASQDDPSVVDVDGRPITAPQELIILGGGDGPHDVVRYLLEKDTPLLWGGSPATVTERATSRVIVQGATDNDNDYILLQVIAEPKGGTTSFSAQGFGLNGTIAAALYFEKSVAEWITEGNVSWVVLRWTDSDEVTGASIGDSFVIIESG